MADHKKIGIMGGTFNPIHFGHLLLAETAFHQFQLDEILIMQTKNIKRFPILLRKRTE